MSKNLSAAETERQRILALTSSANTEERWIEFMREQGYPTDSPKMADAQFRLSTRVKNLDVALAKSQEL